jgi:small subunit ribosomal protein S7
MGDIKLYNKWSFDDVQVSDQGLVNYINVDPIIVPKTNGYHHNTAFYKTKINIIERLMIRLAVSGHKNKKHKLTSGYNTGKSLTHNSIMYEVLEELERRTKLNPIQVLVKAIENASPREEVITIERSGARYAQAVDIGPQRRVDLVLRYLAQGATHKAFASSITLKDALVEEIMDSYNWTGNSMALSRRNEIEKMAAAAK